ncbi:MAG TPA: hypothetical protein VGR26_18815 [Acidimicrobiales bacterium]|nr:hypothetical protein [Acidimicrobiales bacterium]
MGVRRRSHGGELLVIVPTSRPIGARLQLARELPDAEALLASMMGTLAIVILVDTAFGTADRSLRRRRGGDAARELKRWAERSAERRTARCGTGRWHRGDDVRTAPRCYMS